MTNAGELSILMLFALSIIILVFILNCDFFHYKSIFVNLSIGEPRLHSKYSFSQAFLTTAIIAKREVLL